MVSSLAQIFRSRWFAGCVHAALWVLLYLAVVHLRGSHPPYEEVEAANRSPQSLIPVTRLATLFAPSNVLTAPLPIPSTNAFWTRHFVPPPAPAPPPPTTRKFELTYLGYYQSAEGPRQAMVRLADSFLVAPVGSRILSNLHVATASMEMLTLTNPAAQTNALPLNTKKEVEVPIKE